MPPRHRRRALGALTGVLALGACGRVRFGAIDAGLHDDAWSLDAPGGIDAAPGDAATLDAADDATGPGDAYDDGARGPDVSGPDAGGPDAGGPDAGGPDAAVDDAATPDAGSSCRSRIRWLDGPSADSLDGVLTDGGDTLYLQGRLSAVDVLAGWPLGACIGRLDGETVRWTDCGTPEALALDGAELVVLHRDRLLRLDTLTGARRELGSFSPTVSNAGDVASDGTGGSFFGVTSSLGGVRYDGADLGAGTSDVALGFVDSSGALGPFWALVGVDNDVVHDVVRVGPEIVAVGGGNTPPLCVGATCTSEGSFALRISRAAPPRFEEALGDAYRVTADAAGNVYGVGLEISSIAPDGALRWSHRSSPLFAEAVVDEARARLWVVGRMNLPLTYGATTVALLGSGETLGVLSFDTTTGALTDALTFGGVGDTIHAGGVAVAPDGTLIVAGYSSATFGACVTDPPPAAARSTAAFLLRIAPDA